MARTAILLVTMALLLITAATYCEAVDETLKKKAKGPEVVEATVDLIHESCVFDDDKLMLRRIAWVETSDGEDAHTFKKNGNDYYGGIWQVRVPITTTSRIYKTIIIEQKGKMRAKAHFGPHRCFDRLKTKNTSFIITSQSPV